jgi:hypothetical protein
MIFFQPNTCREKPRCVSVVSLWLTSTNNVFAFRGSLRLNLPSFFRTVLVRKSSCLKNLEIRD